jgi:hypothetical protein
VIISLQRVGLILLGAAVPMNAIIINQSRLDGEMRDITKVIDKKKMELCIKFE